MSRQIPDDAAHYAATGSFLSHVAPRIRRAGYLAVPNVSLEWDDWRTALIDWTPYVSGWENEHFTNWPGQDGRFTRGIVVVNPTASARRVHAVRLAPTTAAILSR